MSLALRMCQVVALVAVDRETQLALVRSQMILHKVGILGEVDLIEGQASKTFSAVDVGQ